MISVTNLFPSNAMISTQDGHATAEKCIDGVTSGSWQTVCETPRHQLSRWIALEFHSQVEVTIVVLYARSDCCWERTKNLEVRIADELPTSSDSMFTGGQLLGYYEGPATSGEIIKVEGSPHPGKYVLVQMNNPQPLPFHEVTVFGKGTRTSCQSRSSSGKLYGGKAETTEAGFTCRNWTDIYWKYPIVDGNNCRNPEPGEGERLWCYVSEDNAEDNNENWDYCSVPFCGETGDHASFDF